MKRISLSILSIALVAAVFFMAGCTKNAYQITKTSDNLTFDMEINNNPPTAGKNILTIVLKDQKGNFVNHAHVMVKYFMPAMPGMPAMDYIAHANHQGNSYKAELDIPMACSWDVIVMAHLGEETQKVKFNIDVR